MMVFAMIVIPTRSVVDVFRIHMKDEVDAAVVEVGVDEVAETIVTLVALKSELLEFRLLHFNHSPIDSHPKQPHKTHH